MEISTPNNVILHKYTLADFRACVIDRLRLDGNFVEPYKLNDFKPAYGLLFEEYIAGYDYFGWGDIDVIFGRVDHFLKDLLGKWEVLSFSEFLPSNHFLLLRNTHRNRSLFQQIENYRTLLQSPDHQAMDDVAFSSVLMSQPNVWFEELHSTPHIHWRTWLDGTFNFPTRWTWNNGQLTNNLDIGYEFLYFHFMVWKGGYRDYYLPSPNWEGLPASALIVDPAATAFTLSPDGLKTKAGDKLRPLLKAGLDASPVYSLRRRLRIKRIGLGL
ncbi:MAG: hypothetical protein EA353_14090 [Puniceicoccaceae bacterium]|nr:MAG: hypothetical protein EA353_14090 [Puniceicoccaceae bacterium]